jgi:hypothetical protein
VLDRIGPGGGRATTTVSDLIEEYLEMHQAAAVTIAKLRWLLGKATATLGDKRLADPQGLSRSEVSLHLLMHLGPASTSEDNRHALRMHTRSDRRHL